MTSLHKQRRAFGSTAVFLGVVLLIVIAAEFLATSGGWLRLIVPKPSGVARSLYEISRPSPSFAGRDVATTLMRVLAGLVVGSIPAIPLGLVTGIAGRKLAPVRFFVDFCRSIPQVALFPVFALLFGIGTTGKIAMASASTFLIVFVAAADGATFGRRERSDSFEWFDAPPWARFVHLTLPQSLPAICVGIRIAASVAMIVVLVAEMLYGTLDGVGYRLYVAQLRYSVDEMWALILVVGILGVILNRALRWADLRLVHWDRVEHTR